MLRTLLTILVLGSLSLASPAADQREGQGTVQHADTLLLADADRAAVASQLRSEITDHYGDPDQFVKYIIRRPPALA